MITVSPQWFNIISTVYNAVSFIVAGAIFLLGWKAYKLIKEKKYLHFAVSFFFIMLSFVVMALTNLIVYLNLGANVSMLLGIINAGYITYALLTIVGFLLLVILSFKIKDVKLIVLISIVLAAALLVFDFIMMFHLILLLLALMLSYHFYKNCVQKKTTNSKLVFAAFTSMMMSHIFHMASASSYISAGTGEVIYVIGSTILVAGYIILLAALLRFK